MVTFIVSGRFVLAFSDERGHRWFALLYLPVLVNIPPPTVIHADANDGISFEWVWTTFSSNQLMATKAESELNQEFSPALQTVWTCREPSDVLTSVLFFFFAVLTSVLSVLYPEVWSSWAIHSSPSLFVFCSIISMLFSVTVILIYILGVGRWAGELISLYMLANTFSELLEKRHPTGQSRYIR